MNRTKKTEAAYATHRKSNGNSFSDHAVILELPNRIRWFDTTVIHNDV